MICLIPEYGVLTCDDRLLVYEIWFAVLMTWCPAVVDYRRILSKVLWLDVVNR